MIAYFKDREIVLASASPRRREILGQIGLEPLIYEPETTELSHLGPKGPGGLVRENARRKAQAAQQVGLRRQCLIIAADTVVILEGRLFGKPSQEREAAQMLAALSGRRHYVYTGICLLDPAKGRGAWGSRRSAVTFAKLSQKQIAAYIATGEPLDKAGAYGIQGAGGLFVERIEGDYGTVMGLSLPLLAKLAARLQH